MIACVCLGIGEALLAAALIIAFPVRWIWTYVRRRRDR